MGDAVCGVVEERKARGGMRCSRRIAFGWLPPEPRISLSLFLVSIIPPAPHCGDSGALRPPAPSLPWDPPSREPARHRHRLFQFPPSPRPLRRLTALRPLLLPATPPPAGSRLPPGLLDCHGLGGRPFGVHACSHPGLDP